MKRRIVEMSERVEQQLVRMMCNNFFSMQVEESTLPENLVCVRLIVDNTTYEELAFSQLMESYSTGRPVFKKLKNILK